MSREEEISKASIVTYPPNPAIKSIDFYMKELREAFVLGAKWSDSHPNTEFFKIEGAEDLNLEQYD